ncbi:hypothetical protein ACIA8G_13825 [Lentzea sp. NPDC051213]|uniref:hypothetical protein n=1 Tax=Lentzea sp. NPDC051213 TaxID=3364126 RepID=UPI00378E0C29
MRIALVAAVAAALITTPAAHAAPAVEDLGTLPGDLRSTAQDINESGSIAGVSMGTGTAQHAVRWDRNAPIKKLNDLGFDSWSSAINSGSSVVGYVIDSASEAQPARWDASGALTVLTVPGAAAGVAYDINDSGTVTGTARINGVSHAVVWDRAGTATVFGEGSGRFITEAGWVLGFSGDQPARWTDQGNLFVFDSPGAFLNGHNQAADAIGSVSGEGVLWVGRRRAPLGAGSSPRDLSDNGWIVGVAGNQAVRWRAEEGTVAQPIAPAPSTANDINNAGTVAGTAGSWAVTWSSTGVQTQLPVPSGANRSTVSGLSENDQVIGVVGFPGNIYRAAVWR